jgi:hypothetical protein
MVDDNDASPSLPCWRHRQCSVHLTWATLGETPDLVLLDRKMTTLGAVLLLNTLFWSRRWPEVVLRWSGVTLSASTMASLSGVEKHGLDGGCVMIYRRRAEEPSGLVVALTAGRASSVCWSLLKMGLRKTEAATEFVGPVVLLACHGAVSWSLWFFWWGASVCCWGIGPCS